MNLHTNHPLKLKPKELARIIIDFFRFRSILVYNNKSE